MENASSKNSKTTRCRASASLCAVNNAILEISWLGLLIAFVPTAIVIGIMVAWRSVVGTAVYATARMLVQLLVIGYVLIYIFETDN